ncbi:MAG: pitrilysin family protein [Elainellaceae cyanobacterium]
MPIVQTVARPLHNRTVHRAVLENGIVVLAVENSAADIVATRIFIRAGSRYEPPELAGLSHLWAAVLTKGTQNLSSQEIAERVESVGASLGADSAADYCLLSLKTVAADLPEMLALAAELLQVPSFPEAEVELERRLAQQGIRSMQEQPFAVAHNQLRQAMYGNHPYALPGIGTEATVAELNRDILQDYHHSYFRPENMVVSVAGRIDPEKAIALIDHHLGNWLPPQPQNSALPSAPSLPVVTAHPKQVITQRETQQAIVMLGYLTESVQSQDHTVLKLLSTYLGNGLSSRLFVELREKRGLAYEVSAFYPTRVDASHFVVYIGTAPENTAIAQAGLRHEIERLRTTLLNPDELQAAKNKLLGQYALSKQTNAQLAQLFGWYEILGLGIGYDEDFQKHVSSVTAEEIQQVVLRYFSEPYVSLVGPELAVNLLQPSIVP